MNKVIKNSLKSKSTKILIILLILITFPNNTLGFLKINQNNKNIKQNINENNTKTNINILENIDNSIIDYKNINENQLREILYHRTKKEKNQIINEIILVFRKRHESLILEYNNSFSYQNKHKSTYILQKIINSSNIICFIEKLDI